MIDIKEPNLFLYHPQTKALIDSHVLETGKWQLIQKASHKRDSSKSIETLKQSMYQQVEQDSFALTYINQIMTEYPRYRRDQLTFIKLLLKKAPDLTVQAMSDYHERYLWSAND